jgi:outer membrane protein assembly factor BamB
MQNNDSHDKNVEIVDLDTSGSPWQQRILHLARRLLAKAPARGKVMALALLGSIAVLLIVLQPSLHFVPRRTAHPTPSATPIPKETSITMSAANGMVYIAGRDGSLTARQTLNGIVRWQIKSSTEVYYTPAASSQSVYTAVALGKSSMVEARQASNGKLQWRSSPLPSALLRLQAQEGVVYANTQDDTIYAFNGNTGKVLWHNPAVAELSSIVSIDNNTLYLSADDDRLLVYGPAMGNSSGSAKSMD